VEKRGEKKKNPTGVLGGLALWAPPVQCGRLIEFVTYRFFA